MLQPRHLDSSQYASLHPAPHHDLQRADMVSPDLDVCCSLPGHAINPTCMSGFHVIVIHAASERSSSVIHHPVGWRRLSAWRSSGNTMSRTTIDENESPMV